MLILHLTYAADKNTNPTNTAEPPSFNTGCPAACNKVTLTLFVLVFKIAKAFKILRVDAVLLCDLNLRSWFPDSHLGHRREYIRFYRSTGQVV